MSKLNEKIQQMIGPDWGWNKGLTYDPAFAQFRLNQKGLNMDGEVDPLNMSYDLRLGGDSRLNLNGTYDPMNLSYGANIGEGGNFGLNASMPLLGGTLGFEANRQDDNNQYWLRYRLGQMPEEPIMQETSDKREILKALIEQYRAAR